MHVLASYCFVALCGAGCIRRLGGCLLLCLWLGHHWLRLRLWLRLQLCVGRQLLMVALRHADWWHGCWLVCWDVQRLLLSCTGVLLHCLQVGTRQHSWGRQPPSSGCARAVNWRAECVVHCITAMAEGCGSSCGWWRNVVWPPNFTLLRRNRCCRLCVHGNTVAFR